MADDGLRVLADRIEARALRCRGELLKQFDGRGAQLKSALPTLLRKMTPPSFSPTATQREAANRASVSERQQLTAVRVANVTTESPT